MTNKRKRKKLGKELMAELNRNALREAGEKKCLHLIAQGAPVNIKVKKTGETALMGATSLELPRVVKALIKKGAKPDARDQHGDTALIYAAEHTGKTDIMDMLLSAGADIHAKNNMGNSALILAAANEFYSGQNVPFLISRGANVNDTGSLGYTPLMQASLHNSTGTAIALLQSEGININVRQNYGKTAFNIAVINARDTEILEAFLIAGADINTQSDDDSTPIITETIRRNSHAKTIIPFLVANGAEIDARDRHGQTALMDACQFGAPWQAKLLVSLGADPDLQNNYGRTAITMADARTYSGITGKVLSDMRQD